MQVSMDDRTDDSAATFDEVESFLAAHPDIDAVDYLITDTNGVLRGKWAPADSLRKAFETGINFPLSLFGLDIWGREVTETGLHVESGDPDGFCRAVPGSLRKVSWAERPTAQAMLQMFTDEGAPFFADPRQRLAAVVDRMAAAGFSATSAFELEFYLVDPDSIAHATDPTPVLQGNGGPDRQNMYGLADLSDFETLFSDIRAFGTEQGLPIDTIVSEAAPGQFEVNLKHRGDALAAADDAMMLKRLVAAAARRHGLKASFMAKPFFDWPGNGMHVHVSLIGRDGKNAFADPETGEARHLAAIAGLMENMAASTLVFVPSWNGFRRLQPGSYAPTAASWGYNNRSVALRVPASSPEATRIEHRISGADANPYLVLTAVLSAMLDGMEQGLTPPPPVETNAYESAAPSLPSTMLAALSEFASSDFIARAFGADYRDLYAAVKRAEIDEFLTEITPLERSTYL
ncbi:glutamine synthetase [Rhodobium orientis]|uniref:Glutamine synthetase n=1 Tax=Rhodobium orientis TaxID=34017 RepID=A0A327JKJ7_9HYPH|nr:glutamine synthetase family protein [Rhodobium orientis]MBB4304976.1 glutamine synthetase [Rhodobium orientis]MBK5948816.1 glutamine synthetase [Rhodobium orientis]RAI26425.1 glutamine synthetase [Rhodobium orientis]